MQDSSGGNPPPPSPNSVRKHSIPFALGVASSIVASIIIAVSGVTYGYQQGKAVGIERAEKARYAELEAEIAAQKKEDLASLATEIAARREERYTSLTAEINLEREQRLKALEADMDDLVQGECGRRLQEEYDKGQKEGIASGYSRGRIEADKQLVENDRICTQRLQDARKTSELWNRFENLILMLEEYRFSDDEQKRIYVESVIRLGLSGRNAGEAIADVFNGNIDRLREALEANDIDAAMAIIEQLRLTLPNMHEVFEPAFIILTEGIPVE